MNDVKLQEGHPADENLRPIKVGETATSLELTQFGNGARITGDLEVTGDIKGNIKDKDLGPIIIKGDLSVPLTGVVAANNGSPTVEGTGTSFTTELAVADAIKIKSDVDNGYEIHQVASITDDDTFRIAENYAGTNATGLWVLKDPNLLTVSSGAGSEKIKINKSGNISCGDIILDSSGDITLDAATYNVNILQAHLNMPVDRKVVFGNEDEYITGDDTDLAIHSSGGINLTAIADPVTIQAYNDLNINSGATNTIKLHNGAIGTTYIQLKTLLDTGDYCKIATTTAGATTISTVDDGGNSANLSLDIDGDITLNSVSGNFISEKNGTEFSVANSAYAGMILGYKTIGIDAARDSYAVTNAFVTVDSEMKVMFIAPPSGVVEIEVFIYADASSGSRPLKFGLSDNVSYSQINFPNTNDVTNEHEVITVDETDEVHISHKWVVTDLVSGDEYEWWLGAACSHNLIYTLWWGGTTSGQYAPFIMKATALPAAVADFAVYG